MIKELKISLPFYKIAYAAAFIVILSFVRGVSDSRQIGIAMEPAIAILAAAFCADTYALELVSRRSEVWRLYPMRRRIRSIGRRLVIQQLFLLFLAAVGYGLFFLTQKPRLLNNVRPAAESEILQFTIYLAAAAVTLGFWGILSNTLACVFRSLWAGIGGSLVLWVLTNSTSGDRYLGPWNLFSYVFRNIEDSGDISWLAGKCFCIVSVIAMIAILPDILRKRG